MPRRRFARWTAAALSAGSAAGVLVTLAIAGGAPAVAAGVQVSPGQAPGGPVVVVGFGGVRWADVSPAATPALWSLVGDGAISDIAVRSVRTTTCPMDGWLTVSAGRRAADLADPEHPDNPPCREIEVTPGPAASTGGPRPRPAPSAATVQRWDDALRAARDAGFDARPGLLGDTLATAGVCATAIGPGAGVMLARSDGTLSNYLPGPSGQGTSSSPPTSPAGGPSADPACPLTVVDAGSVRDPDDPSDGVRVPAGSGSRASQVVLIDRAVGEVLDAAPADARVIVVSLADDGGTPHLQLLAARGPGFGPGWLRSSSTRQTGLVQLPDLTPTVLALLDVPRPTELLGAPLRTVTAASGDAPTAGKDRLRRVLDLEAAAQAVHPLTPQFFTGLVAVQLLVYGAAAVALRRDLTGRRRHVVRAAVRRSALVFAAVPVSTYLANTVPWWRSSQHLLTIVLVVAGYTGAISLVAQCGPWRRRPFGPFGAVAGMTAVILAADIVTGSRLQTSSLMGLQPVNAGRFYGFSNVAFALFATGAILAAVAAAHHYARQGRRRVAALSIAATGTVATAIDVSPMWGSDFGGPIGMVPAFAVLTLLVLGVRLSWLRLLVIAAGTVAMLTAVSVADWLRPAADQTHLGRFVQTVIDGGAWSVISRKASQNVDILLGSPLSLLMPFGALLVALVVLRPAALRATALVLAYDDSPTLRHGLRCLLLMLAIGFAVNDTGTVIPVIGATLAIPLVIAACLQALLTRTARESGPDDTPGGRSSHQGGSAGTSSGTMR